MNPDSICRVFLFQGKLIIEKLFISIIVTKITKIGVIMKGVALFGAILILVVTIIYYLKPNQEQAIQQQNTASTVAAPLQETASAQVNEPIQNDSKPSDHSELSAAAEEPLFDTKSDPSIQPIDPETDPGNQIISTN